MGCTATKADESPEEKALQLGEESLLYHTKFCIEVDHIHRKYSTSGQINPSQFSEISKRLNIASTNLSANTKLKTFYDWFKSGNNYMTDQLLILGVLTSKGSAAEKSKILFEIEDRVSMKRLKRKDVEKIALGLLKVSIEALSLIHLIEGENHVSDEDIANYTRRLQGKIDAALPVLTDLLIGSRASEVSLTEFINNFRDDEIAKLISPKAIRKFVGQQSANVVIISEPT